MKKILVCLTLMLSAVIFTNVYASVGDYFTITDMGGNDLIRFDSNFNFFPEQTKVGLGSSTKPWASLSVSSFTNPINTKDTWSDVPTASSFTIYTMSIASGVIFLADYTIGVDGITQMQTGRTVQASMVFTGAGSATYLRGTVLVHGVNTKGVAVSETIAISTGNTAYYSNNAFLYISSFTARLTYKNTSATTSIFLNVGSGEKLGLSNDVITNTDVYGIREGTALVSPGSVVVDTDYDTVDFVTDPNDSNEYEVYYKIRKAP